jgi:L-alanine-DL-glutamate epimerase-like enolase superfamily enzyme
LRITDIELIISQVDEPGALDESPAKPGEGSDFAPKSEIVVVTIKTDGGIDGHGFGWGVKGGARLAHAIAEVYRPELLGEDPLDRERLWHKAHKADRFGGLTSFAAYGALDVALWDIGAKQAGIPLYKYIGAYRDVIPAYASSPFLETPDQYAEMALSAQKLGYTAFKLHPPGEAKLDIECCRAVRDAVGDTMELMSDPVGGAYDHEDALRVGRALEKLDYLWLEEPLYDHDIHGLEMLSSTLDIPICAAEWNSDFYSKLNFLKGGAADIIRADVSWTGGITGSLKSAHLAEAFGVNCEPHMTVLSLMDLANLHLALAIKNCRYLEIPYPDGAKFGLKNPVDIDSNGMVHPPDSPGLGADIDWDAIYANEVARI